MALSDNPSHQISPGLKPAGWIVLAGLLTGAGTLAYPWTVWDSAVATYIGDIIVRGGAPFRDAWNVKGIGIDFAYALSILAFGKTALGLRLFDLVWQICTALVVARLAARAWETRAAGVVAGSAYLLAYFSQEFNNMAEADGMLSLPLILSMDCALSALETDRFWLWALAGAGVGITVLFKLPMGLFGVALLGVALARPATAGLLRRPAALALGLCLPLAGVALYLVAKGALSDYVTAQFIVAPALASHLRKMTSLECLKFTAMRSELIFYLGLAIVGLSAVAVRMRRGKSVSSIECLLLSWMAVVVIAMVAHGAYLEYEYLGFAAPLAVFAAEPVDRLWREARKNRAGERLLALYGTLALLLIVPSVKIGRHSLFAWEKVTGRKAFNSAQELGGYLRGRTSPQDRICIWGNLPVVYLYADRQASTRFVHSDFVSAPWNPVDFQTVFLSEFAAHPPLYFLVSKEKARSNCFGGNPAPVETLRQFPALRKIIAAEYEIDRDDPLCAIYRRKNLAGAARSGLP